MKTGYKNWLEPGWEQKVKLIILSSLQATKPIADWIMLVESTNALLISHPCILSTNYLCNHIQSHIHADTMTTSTMAELHLIIHYEKYKCGLKILDNTWIHADELLKVTVKQMMGTSLAMTTTTTMHNTNTTSTTVSTGSTDGSIPRPSNYCPLTTIERNLLMEHGGCFFCHHFYVGHIAPACTQLFSKKVLYHPLTEADTLGAKKCNKSKKFKAAPAAAKGEHKSGSPTGTCGFIHGKPIGQVTHRSEFQGSLTATCITTCLFSHYVYLCLHSLSLLPTTIHMNVP